MYSARTYCTYFVFRAHCANIISQNNKRKFVSMQIAPHLNLDLLHNLPFVIIEQKSHLRIYSKLKTNTLPDCRMHWQQSFNLNAFAQGDWKNISILLLTRRKFRRSHTQHRVGRAQVAFCRRLRVFNPFDRNLSSTRRMSHMMNSQCICNTNYTYNSICAPLSHLCATKKRIKRTETTKVQRENWKTEYTKAYFKVNLINLFNCDCNCRNSSFVCSSGKKQEEKKTRKKLLEKHLHQYHGAILTMPVCMFAAVNGPLLLVYATQ